MRSGSRTSGRSSLPSASEAESGNERFGSVGKTARLSFASESDSDLEAILKLRDSTDTVKATPKSQAAQLGPRQDNATGRSGDSDASAKFVPSTRLQAGRTLPQPQASGDSKDEVKFLSRLGHKRSQSTLPTASPRPYSPAPSAIPAYTQRTSVRVFTNSAPSTNPLRSSVPLKYAGLPAAIPLEAVARSLSTSSSSAISLTSHYHSGNGEHRRVSGGDVEP